MTPRELFYQIMFYGEFDRMPLIHWAVWEETAAKWKNEGLPEFEVPGVYLETPEVHDYFGTTPVWTFIGGGVGLYPPFPEETIEETAEYRVLRDSGGVVIKDWKHKDCIPQQIEFTLKSADEWPAYKERLQPDPGRVLANLDDHFARCLALDVPVAVETASMMGWIRNWMGVENMSYLMYDAPGVYAEMVDTLANLTCWYLDQVLPRAKDAGLVPDLGFGWEDICGKSGPLVSPSIFEEHVAPGYRKIREKLESHDVHLLGIDSDGYVEPLVPGWLGAGVNVMFPVEPGTWGATPEHMRERFGKELRIVGGFNKLVLERGVEDIDREIDAHMELMREGGFLMMPDHLITPGTPLENYRYYLARMRERRL